MIHYYRLHQKILFSSRKINELPKISLDKVRSHMNDTFYYLKEEDWQQASSLVALIHPDQISDKREGIQILQRCLAANRPFEDFPDWMNDKIVRREVGLCNTGNPRWKDRLEWLQQPLRALRVPQLQVPRLPRLVQVLM